MAAAQSLFERNESHSDDDSDCDSMMELQRKKKNMVLDLLRSASQYPLSIHEDVIAKLPDLDQPPVDTKSFFWGIILMLAAAFFSSVTTTILKYNHLSQPSFEIFVFRMLVQLLLTVVVASISVVRSHSTCYDYESVSLWSATESEMDDDAQDDAVEDAVEMGMGVIYPPNHRLHRIEYPRARRRFRPRLCCKVRCVGIWRVFKDFYLESSSDTKWHILARGICGGTGAVCYYRAVSLIPFMDCLFVLSLFPVFSALCAKWLLQETVSMVHAVALLMMLFGTLTMTNPSFLFGGDDRDDRVYDLSETNWRDIVEGYGLALVGSICYGFVFVYIRLCWKAPTFALIFSNGLFGCLEAILICALSHRALPAPTIREVAIAAGIGGIGYLSQNAENRSGKCCFASLAAMIRVTEVLWEFLWQNMGAAQPANQTASIGAGCLALAIVVVIWDKYREIKRAEVHFAMEGDDELNTEIDSDHNQIKF